MQKDRLLQKSIPCKSKVMRMPNSSHVRLCNRLAVLKDGKEAKAQSIVDQILLFRWQHKPTHFSSEDEKMFRAS